MSVITSRTNERIKQTRALMQTKYRRETGLHLVESDKLVMEAIQSDAMVVSVYLEEGFSLPVPDSVPVTLVSRSVMEAITESKTPQHACAVVQTPDVSIPDMFPEGLIVVLDHLQDAGNVGTIIRTADALGAVGVLLDGCADPFGGKALRAAMGSTYHLPIWIHEAASAIDLLKAQGFLPICGHLHGESNLPTLQAKMVLVIGNEGNGVSDEVAARCQLYRLPMKGRAESLNASIAASILMYELTRGF